MTERRISDAEVKLRVSMANEEKRPKKKLWRRALAILLAVTLVASPVVMLKTQIEFSRLKYVEETAAYAAQVTEDGAAPLYAELEKRAAGSGKMQVYLTCDWADEKARGSVGTLAGILSDETMTVIAGDPRDSEKDYKELLGSDIVVMAEVLCGSAKKDFRDILEICRRNELPVLGCITLLDPARC